MNKKTIKEGIYLDFTDKEKKAFWNIIKPLKDTYIRETVISQKKEELEQLKRELSND